MAEAPTSLRGVGGRRRPVLVTGVPRSGTTWLARELATIAGGTLPGREPMNPRRNQFALAGTLTGWTRLTAPSPRQVRVLRRCYRGREPRTFSRYGVNQWRALAPWSQTFVKDPFALLSVPAIVEHTGALPVVVYRHPGAVLASYRRMGWRPDTQEIRALQGVSAGPPPRGDAEAMVEFWNFLHRGVLEWLPGVADAVVVSHAEASGGGDAALHELARACGATGGARAPKLRRQGEQAAAVPAAGQLHGFERSSEEVTQGWRKALTHEEIATIEDGTAGIWAALQERRFPLSGS